MPDQITGKVEIIVALADGNGVEPQALVALLSTWARAVDIGLFGSGRIHQQEYVETNGRQVSGRFDCERVPKAAFHLLVRMIRHFSQVKGRVESFSLLNEGGQRLVADGNVTIPSLTHSIPFAVEYPEDLKHYLHVEIEFRLPLTPRDRNAIFSALSVWDALIEAVADEKWWEGEESDYETRLLSPAIVEHQIEGYFASFECLDFMVFLCLRLHEGLAIERLTME